MRVYTLLWIMQGRQKHDNDQHKRIELQKITESQKKQLTERNISKYKAMITKVEKFMINEEVKLPLDCEVLKLLNNSKIACLGV